MNRRPILSAAAAAIAITAGPLAAQDFQPEPLQIEPYAGAFVDSYDISPDGDRTGLMLGLRIGYPVTARTRLIGNLAYASSHDVANPNGLSSYWVYDNTWAMTTLGAEYEAIARRTSVSLGLQVGAGWRRNDLAGSVGDPDPSTDQYSHGGFTAIDVVVPGITVRRQITPSVGVSLGLHDHIFDVLEGPTNHSVGLTFGFTLR